MEVTSTSENDTKVSPCEEPAVIDSSKKVPDSKAEDVEGSPADDSATSLQGTGRASPEIEESNLDVQESLDSSMNDVADTSVTSTEADDNEVVTEANANEHPIQSCSDLDEAGESPPIQSSAEVEDIANTAETNNEMPPLSTSSDASTKDDVVSGESSLPTGSETPPSDISTPSSGSGTNSPQPKSIPVPPKEVTPIPESRSKEEKRVLPKPEPTSPQQQSQLQPSPKRRRIEFDRPSSTPRIVLTSPKRVIRKPIYHKIQKTPEALLMPPPPLQCVPPPPVVLLTPLPIQKPDPDSSETGSDTDSDTDSDTESDAESDKDVASQPQCSYVPPPPPPPTTSELSSIIPEKKVYCYCRCPYDEVSDMIACDDQACPIEWYHYECVGVVQPPQGQWYCPGCRRARAILPK